jgi:hypothetical protein
MTHLASVPLLISLLAGAALALRSRIAARNAARPIPVVARRRGVNRRAK